MLQLYVEHIIFTRSFEVIFESLKSCLNDWTQWTVSSLIMHIFLSPISVSYCPSIINLSWHSKTENCAEVQCNGQKTTFFTIITRNFWTYHNTLSIQEWKRKKNGRRINDRSKCHSTRFDSCSSQSSGISKRFVKYPPYFVALM